MKIHRHAALRRPACGLVNLPARIISPSQMAWAANYCKGSNFYKLKIAWKAFNDGRASKDQRELLQNHLSYKLKMAWKAFNDGSPTKVRRELLENRHIYKLKMAKKAKKEGHATNCQLALIEKCRKKGNWKEYLEEPKEFQKTQGHCDVPGDVGLAQWVSQVSDPTCLQHSFNILFGKSQSCRNFVL